MRGERHCGAGEAWIDCQDGCTDGIGGRLAATRAAGSEPPPLQATSAGASGLRRRPRRRQRHRRIHLAGGMAAGEPAATPVPDSGCRLLFRTDRPSRPRQGHHPRAPVSSRHPRPLPHAPVPRPLPGTDAAPTRTPTRRAAWGASARWAQALRTSGQPQSAGSLPHGPDCNKQKRTIQVLQEPDKCAC